MAPYIFMERNGIHIIDQVPFGRDRLANHVATVRERIVFRRQEGRGRPIADDRCERLRDDERR